MELGFSPIIFLHYGSKDSRQLLLIHPRSFFGPVITGHYRYPIQDPLLRYLTSSATVAASDWDSHRLGKPSHSPTTESLLCLEVLSYSDTVGTSTSLFRRRASLSLLSSTVLGNRLKPFRRRLFWRTNLHSIVRRDSSHSSLADRTLTA